MRPSPRRWCWVPWAAVLGACSGTALEPADAGRFDARDALVDPRDATTADAPAPDAAVIDVTLADLGRDAGADADASAAFDLPPTVDAPGCVAAAESYATAVREAQRCGVESECAVRVCETLCCTCEVFIDPRAPSAAGLAGLRDRWRSLGCQSTMPCTAVPCGAPISAVCSTEGRCVTLRRDADGGSDASTDGDLDGG